MGTLVTEIVVIFLLLVVNGIFAMSEMAVVAARKTRLQQKAAEGSRKAKAALELASNPSRFLTTVQIGITLIGILAGAFGGATISERLAPHLRHIPVVGQHSDLLSVAIVVLGITYLSLIIGELVPKRIGLNNAEGIAIAISGYMKALSVIGSPLVNLLSISSDGMIRLLELLGMRPSPTPPVSEEEIKLLIQQGTKVGIFEEAEQDMIEAVLRLGDRRVGALMTPRSQIVWIDPADPPEEITQKIMTSQHSRFPLAQGDVENLLGILHTKDVLVQCLQSQPLELKAIVREPLFVPENMPVLKILELFRQKGTHLSLVVDEYGGLVGLITHNDILEGIAGDLSLPGDEEEPKAQRREDGSLLADGLLHIDRLKEILDIERLPDEDSGQYQTVGGFVMHQLGTVPSPGQWFQWQKYRFEVLDMDWPRVDKVLVTFLPESDREDQA